MSTEFKLTNFSVVSFISISVTFSVAGSCRLFSSNILFIGSGFEDTLFSPTSQVPNVCMFHSLSLSLLHSCVICSSIGKIKKTPHQKFLYESLCQKLSLQIRLAKQATGEITSLAHCTVSTRSGEWVRNGWGSRLTLPSFRVLSNTPKFSLIAMLRVSLMVRTGIGALETWGLRVSQRS